MSAEKPLPRDGKRKVTESRTSSTSGMPTTVEFQLSAEEIINILKVCRDTGVSSLDLGPLSVRFGLPVATDRGIATIPLENAPLLSPVATLAEPDHEKLGREALEIDELRIREKQIAELT